MISIVISEKGGAERRDVFDQDEITFGRVKGNDVLLPKGNVSKQHARLIVRDGRFIVTDLKSTNGTYVNHRRITHATLVREGDRIYIGDYIVRIETGASDVTGPHAALGASADLTASPEEDSRASLLEPATSSSIEQRSSGRSPLTRNPPFQTPTSHGPLEDVVSHFPLEQDPDFDADPLPFDVPAPPRMPRSLDVAEPASASSPRATASASAAEASLASTGSHPSAASPLSSEATPSARTSQAALDEGRRALLREHVGKLVGRIESELGSAEFDVLPRPSSMTADKVTARLDELVAALPASPELDVATLKAAARRELLGLGPLETLLGDDQLSRIRIAQGEVQLVRRGQPVVFDGIGFATEIGVTRAVRRLCADSGAPTSDGESVLEREIAQGRRLQALLPPAALDGPVVQIRRLRHDPVSLNDLVRSGAISRGIASLLSCGMTARANLLVVGGTDHGVEEVVGSLCLSAPRQHHQIALGDDDFGGRAVRLASRMDDGRLTELVRAATKLAPDHLISRALSGEPLATLLDAIADGQVGVVLASTNGTIRQAVDRLASDLAATRQLQVATAREWLASSFDLALEVSRLRDGRVRVVRIAELRGGVPRDVFTFAFHRTAAGGAVEGSFAASGVIPRIVEDLALRGISLDTAIFRRHPTS